MTREGFGVEKLSLLFELSRGFSALIHLDDRLAQVMAKTEEVLQAESCAVLLLDGARQEMYFPITSDVSHQMEERFSQVRFPADRRIARCVLQHNRPLLVPHVSQDERFYPEVDWSTGQRTDDLLYVPLRIRMPTPCSAGK